MFSGRPWNRTGTAKPEPHQNRIAGKPWKPNRKTVPLALALSLSPPALCVSPRLCYDVLGLSYWKLQYSALCRTTDGSPILGHATMTSEGKKTPRSKPLARLPERHCSSHSQGSPRSPNIRSTTIPSTVHPGICNIVTHTTVLPFLDLPRLPETQAPSTEVSPPPRNSVQCRCSAHLTGVTCFVIGRVILDSQAEELKRQCPVMLWTVLVLVLGGVAGLLLPLLPPTSYSVR